MRRRTFRTSIVVTVAGSVLQGTGCGGSTTDGSGPENTGGSAHATGGTGGATGGSQATGGAGPGSGGRAQGTGGTLPADGGTTGLEACSTTLLASGGPTCPPSGLCQFDVKCAGSSPDLVVDCGAPGPYAWSIVDTACDKPYDHCDVVHPGPYQGATCLEGTWVMNGIGGNPPAACPEAAPAPFEACRAEVLGADREYCGYPCGPTTANPGAWSVYHCAPTGGDANPATNQWQPDGNCDKGPNGD